MKEKIFIKAKKIINYIAKEKIWLKTKKIIDYIAIVGVFYILVYQIKTLREIGKSICQYLINWFGNTDMASFKKLYVVGEQVFRVFIIIAIILSIAITIKKYVNEYKLKTIEGENRFEKSLFKYLQNKSVPRAFLITGKWGSGKTYEVNNFLTNIISL